MFCTFCGAQFASTARFCAICGKPIETDPDATVLGDAAIVAANLETFTPDVRPVSPSTPKTNAAYPRPRNTPPSNPTLTTSDPIGGGRFTPGTIVAERYRIVALLGRGGMGEVYRAEDLRLSQVLAIKFLPEALARNESALARFHSEVRVARQVSHPNVCRVFDIGDADGVPFLTMEYVDGEDLSSLIRRIGRLPEDKATEVSRQVCAGLAAAHDRGVVHRDLKPSNVMLDGTGKARITDFGLAGIAANIQGAEVRAGTPAYMAPEQLAGKEVTIRSDIYSLGLVMFEILTGRRAYDAATLPELMKAREQGTITNPSTIVKDLDPLIERVILRCLEKDPAKRPASAMQVAAALPGGDPLTAALAAGETPSPEMVAAAGETEGLRPKVAFACLLAIMVLIAVCSYLGIRESGLERIHPRYSAEVMSHKAQEMVAKLGYSLPPKDTASGFSYDYAFLEFLQNKEKPGSAWNRILSERAPLLGFWFRQSPKEMMPEGYSNASLTPGVVTFSDPAQTFSGMINLRLDLVGRLIYFQAIPPEKEEHLPVPQVPDWQPLFAAAQLDAADFRSSTPVWNSLASADTRAAWDGTWPGTNRPLHVEAAALRGKFVYFQLASDWTTPTRMVAPEATGADRAREIFGTTFAILLLGGGIWLAHRNYSRGKGDRRGAWRLAGFVFILELVVFLTKAHLKFTGETLFLLLLAASTGLFVAAFLWTLYLALEPYVRSKWPQTIVSWSRLLAGNLQDPLVGRDILYGTLMGLAWVLVYYVGYLFDIRVGERPLLPTTELLEGARGVLSSWLGNIVGAILGVLIFFFVLVFLRVMVRNQWLAAGIFVILFATPKILVSSHRLIDTPVWIVIYLIAAFAVVRFGLIVLATATFTANVLLNVPYSLDFSSWYASAALCVVLSFVALAIWGFYTALAGQKLLKEELFD
jgi:serine/threonine-protein kinase